MITNIEMLLYVLFGMAAGGPLWLLLWWLVAERQQQQRYRDWHSDLDMYSDDEDDYALAKPQWRVVKPPIIVDCEIVE